MCMISPAVQSAQRNYKEWEQEREREGGIIETLLVKGRRLSAKELHLFSR